MVLHERGMQEAWLAAAVYHIAVKLAGLTAGCGCLSYSSQAGRLDNDRSASPAFFCPLTRPAPGWFDLVLLDFDGTAYAGN